MRPPEGAGRLRDMPAVTRDNVTVVLNANIGLISDVRVANAHGAEGVGLYRTEFPYMTRTTFPDRHQQAAIYRKILKAFPGQSVVIRTLDIGGDKGLPYFVTPMKRTLSWGGAPSGSRWSGRTSSGNSWPGYFSCERRHPQHHVSADLFG